ncbi:MAG: RNase adapter RapZ [Corynebacterium sp.]|nr:RNase adapter RapZ [Corynebacterium sp.]
MGAGTANRPVLVTGMSGAGLNSAARVLEDMGFYVAENLPPQIILDLIALTFDEASPVRKVGVVSDVRSREFKGNLAQTIDELTARGHRPIILFMEARDDVLIRRFDSVRRTHPLQGSGTLKTGIAREREIISEVKDMADIVIDTSELSIHDLRRAMEARLSTIAQMRRHITIQSFGFKHGSPPDADIVVDARFLPNPFWVPELRPFRGVDPPVADYVLSQPGAKEFVDTFVRMIEVMTPGYEHEGKNFLTIGVGCTGGQHRSVAVAEEIGRRLQEETDVDITVTHRDISRS